MNTQYKDTSPYDGWLQFFDESGKEWKAEYRGCKNWSIFKSDGEGFNHCGLVTAPGDACPRTILNIHHENE